MNYLPFVSWGVYGAQSNSQRACYFASWGMLTVTIPEVFRDTLDYIGHFFYTIRELFRMADGTYRLNTASGKEIKRFKHKPTNKQIQLAKTKYRGY
jgi:hypothetical protein